MREKTSVLMVDGVEAVVLKTAHPACGTTLLSVLAH